MTLAVSSPPKGTGKGHAPMSSPSVRRAGQAEDVRPTIPLQPRPIFLRLGRRDGVMAINRGWHPRDRGRCRLCPPELCNLDEMDRCLVMAPGHLADSATPLFARGGGRQGGASDRVMDGDGLAATDLGRFG
jgi:hypothetical protein